MDRSSEPSVAMPTAGPPAGTAATPDHAAATTAITAPTTADRAEPRRQRAPPTRPPLLLAAGAGTLRRPSVDIAPPICRCWCGGAIWPRCHRCRNRRRRWPPPPPSPPPLEVRDVPRRRPSSLTAEAPNHRQSTTTGRLPSRCPTSPCRRCCVVVVVVSTPSHTHRRPRARRARVKRDPAALHEGHRERGEPQTAAHPPARPPVCPPAYPPTYPPAATRHHSPRASNPAQSTYPPTHCAGARAHPPPNLPSPIPLKSGAAARAASAPAPPAAPASPRHTCLPLSSPAPCTAAVQARRPS